VTETLRDALTGMKGKAKEMLPSEVSDVFFADQERSVRLAERDKFAKTGSRMDDFTLPDAAGGETTLSALVADGPAVLVFYRGAWCPYCNIALRAYQQDLLPALKERGVPLVAISPQAPDGSLTMKEANELEYAVLSDVGNLVARGLGITFQPTEEVRAAMTSAGADLAERNGDGEWELPHPAVLIVEPDRAIRFIDVQPDYTARTEPAQVLEALAPRRMP
jgi:peroxiredoxin